MGVTKARRQNNYGLFCFLRIDLDEDKENGEKMRGEYVNASYFFKTTSLLCLFMIKYKRESEVST